MNLEHYLNWFNNYVKEFGEEPKIILKKEHSLRVAEDMNILFNKLGFDKDYILLAHFLGLYHDIGRFKQWNIYHTFYDDSSVDHADYSAINLFQGGLIKEILTERNYDELIYKAIKYHNKLKLPDNLSIKDESIYNTKLNLCENIKTNFDNIASLYAMAIRDADKIDILNQYLLSNDFLSTDYKAVSNRVAFSFFRNSSVDKNSRKNLNDILILRLSFINDLNLVESLKLLKEMNMLKKIYDVFPDKENTRLYFKYAENRLNYLINRNDDYHYVLKK